MLKAVLFDCDGVLINSEKVHQDRFDAFVRETGVDIDPKAFHLFVGSSPQLDVWPLVYAQARTDWTLQEFKDQVHNFRGGWREPMPFQTVFFPDVIETLQGVKDRGLKLALASSSARDYLDEMMDQCGVRAYFDLVVTGRDFRESKPSPDIYLHCARAFGLEPAECLVVEDSPYGIQAGLAAGMEVLARRDTQFGMDQSGATQCIDDLRQVLTWIDSRGR